MADEVDQQHPAWLDAAVVEAVIVLLASPRHGVLRGDAQQTSRDTSHLWLTSHKTDGNQTTVVGVLRLNRT